MCIVFTYCSFLPLNYTFVKTFSEHYLLKYQTLLYLRIKLFVAPLVYTVFFTTVVHLNYSLIIIFNYHYDNDFCSGVDFVMLALNKHELNRNIQLTYQTSRVLILFRCEIENIIIVDEIKIIENTPVHFKTLVYYNSIVLNNIISSSSNQY